MQCPRCHHKKEDRRRVTVQGQGTSVAGTEEKLAAKTTASGQVLGTALTAKGVAKAESRPGPRATFESEVQITGAGTFVKAGRIIYGKAGRPVAERGLASGPAPTLTMARLPDAQRPARYGLNSQ